MISHRHLMKKLQARRQQRGSTEEKKNQVRRHIRHQPDNIARTLIHVITEAIANHPRHVHTSRQVQETKYGYY